VLQQTDRVPLCMLDQRIPHAGTFLQVTGMRGCVKYSFELAHIARPAHALVLRQPLWPRRRPVHRAAMTTSTRQLRWLFTGTSREQVLSRQWVRCEFTSAGHVGESQLHSEREFAVPRPSSDGGEIQGAEALLAEAGCNINERNALEIISSSSSLFQQLS
jgi:hypothetical protein